MALNINFDSPHTIKIATRVLNKRYGEGEIYKAFDYNFYEDIFVHETKECRRKLRYDNLRHDFILLEQIYKDTPDTFYQDVHTHINSPASLLAEREARLARHVNIHNYNDPSHPNNVEWKKKEPAIPSQKGIDENKKRNKGKNDIKTVLQKETDEWLKNVI